MKIAALAGAVVLGLGGALGLEQFAKPYAIALALLQLVGFVTCGLLLARRDRTELMGSENRSIGRLAVGALLVLPFILTDFRTLWPDIPVRLGALGALLTVAVMIEILGSKSKIEKQSQTVEDPIESAARGAGRPSNSMGPGIEDNPQPLVVSRAGRGYGAACKLWCSHCAC